MKKPATTAGYIKKETQTNDSTVHPTVQWWPMNTPRLLGQPFENPVAKIPTAKTPIAPAKSRI